MPTSSRQVNIKLNPEDLVSLRFAISPLWECIAAFRMWMNRQPPALFFPWVKQIGSSLRETDWSLLAGLALVARGTIPDFLCPPPSIPTPTLDQELEDLMSVPDQVIREEIRLAYAGEVPKTLQHFVRTPSSSKPQLLALLKEFWYKAIAPHWTLLRAVLEGEMLYRARALAVGGIEELLSGLHRDVTIRASNLTVRTTSYWDGAQRKRGLLIIPSIFSWPDIFLTVRPPWRTALNYPCRGIADLWDSGPRASCGSLEQLLGPSCAKIITRLRVPRTTVETAAALHLSPAATSEQITKLWNAGILERTRIGRHVFYSLNQRGLNLFATFQS